MVTSSFSAESQVSLSSLHTATVGCFISTFATSASRSTSVLVIRGAEAVAIVPPQAAALLNLSSTWNGDDLDTWQLSSPCEQWTGLTCDAIGNVVELRLPGSLRGVSLQDAFGNLLYLKVIDLAKNNLTGNFPNSVISLPNLQTLSLGFNRLQGPLPSHFSSLTSLQNLLLGSNRFFGTLPEEIGQLPNLAALDVSSNMFIGSPRASILELPKLVFVDFGDNQFTEAVPLPPPTSLLVLRPDLSTYNIGINYFIGSGIIIKRNTTKVCISDLQGGYAATNLSAFSVGRYSTNRRNCLELADDCPLEVQRTSYECDAFCGLKPGENYRLCGGKGNCQLQGPSRLPTCTCNPDYYETTGGSVGSRDGASFSTCVANASLATPPSPPPAPTEGLQRGRRLPPNEFDPSEPPASFNSFFRYASLGFTGSYESPQWSFKNSTDWREDLAGVGSALQSIKDQSSCAACWVFAPVAALEAAISIVHISSPPNISEQKVVDCQGTWSCSGGYTIDTFKFMALLPGLPHSESYPYNASDSLQGCRVGLTTRRNLLSRHSSQSYASTDHLLVMSLKERARRLPPPRRKVIRKAPPPPKRIRKRPPPPRHSSRRSPPPRRLTSPKHPPPRKHPTKVAPQPRILPSPPIRRLPSPPTAPPPRRPYPSPLPPSVLPPLAPNQPPPLISKQPPPSASPSPPLFAPPAPSISEVNPTPSAPYSIVMFEQVNFLGWFGRMLAVQQQPVTADIEASQDSFVSYTGGFVYNDPDCFINRVTDHTVLIVGYNLDTPVPYWIIRNSWGATWGDGGYMQMAITGGDGICGINTSPALYPVIQGSDPCGPINPCGGGNCTATANGKNTCSCPSNFIPANNTDGTQTCTPKKVCTFFDSNPCGRGTCVDDDNGGYSCLCPYGYVNGSKTDGSKTCVTGTTPETITVAAGVTCETVQSLYNLSEASLASLNPDVNCSSISEGTTLTVGYSSQSATCAVSYTLSSLDSCDSVAALFNVSVSTLTENNAGINCSSISPGLQLCIEEEATEFKCTSYYSVDKDDTCDVVRNFVAKPPLSPADFFALNPGLVCDNLRPKGTGSGGAELRLPGDEVCVEGSLSGATKCSYGYYSVKKGDTCVGIIVKNFKGSNSLFSTHNPKFTCITSRLVVGQLLCLSPSTTSYY